MDIGEKLLNYRKKKGLSQEEVADLLNVTRQTVSKWETNQSTPDFDKIRPICELYGISANELIMDKKTDDDFIKVQNDDNIINIKSKKAIGIGSGILLYFVSLAWIMISIPVMMLNPIIASAIFLIIIGIATFVVIYSSIVYKDKKKIIYDKNDRLKKQIMEIISLITLVIYLLISFMTMKWHITWIIWIIYALIEQIVKLVFCLRSDNDAK